MSLIRHARRLQTKWKTCRSGITILMFDEKVTAATIRRGKLVWVHSLEREATPMSVKVADLLSAAGKPFRSRRGQVVVALPRREAYAKRICGIPAASKSATKKLIAATPTRFFPADKERVMIGGVRRSSAGVWAVAYSQEAVDAIRDACVAAGVSEITIVPLISTFGTGQRDSSTIAYDSGLAFSLMYDERGWLNALKPQLEPSCTSFDSFAGRRGEPSAQVLSACRNALLHAATDPIALRLKPQTRVSSSGARRGVAVGACLISLSAILVVPGVIQAHRTRELRREIASLSVEQRRASAAQAELREATRGLRELAAFDHRVPVSLLLARIARAMPNGSALITLQIDSSSGSAVVVAPRAAEIIDAFERIPGISAATIVGPIAPEQTPVPAPALTGGLGYERVTIQFQRTEPQ